MEDHENNSDRFYASVNWWEPCIIRLFYFDDPKTGNVLPAIYSIAKTILTEPTVRRCRPYDRPRKLIQASDFIKRNLAKTGPCFEYMTEYTKSSSGIYDTPDRAQRIIPRDGRAIQYAANVYLSDKDLVFIFGWEGFKACIDELLLLFYSIRRERDRKIFVFLFFSALPPVHVLVTFSCTCSRNPFMIFVLSLLISQVFS